MFENIPRFSCVFIAQPVMKSKLNISLFGQTPFLYLMGFDYCVQREPVAIFQENKYSPADFFFKYATRPP